jgi:hypothetical protein
VLEVLVAYRAIHLQAYRLRKTTKNLGIFGIQVDTQNRRTQLQSSRKPGLHGMWAPRVVLASMDHASCEQGKRGSLKREPTHAYHSQSVGERNLFDFQSCSGKRGVRQSLATRPRRLVLAPCSRLPCVRHELSRSERETRSKYTGKIGVKQRAWPTYRVNPA